MCNFWFLHNSVDKVPISHMPMLQCCAFYNWACFRQSWSKIRRELGVVQLSWIVYRQDCNLRLLMAVKSQFLAYQQRQLDSAGNVITNLLTSSFTVLAFHVDIYKLYAQRLLNINLKLHKCNSSVTIEIQMQIQYLVPFCTTSQDPSSHLEPAQSETPNTGGRYWLYFLFSSSFFPS